LAVKVNYEDLELSEANFVNSAVFKVKKKAGGAYLNSKIYLNEKSTNAILTVIHETAHHLDKKVLGKGIDFLKTIEGKELLREIKKTYNKLYDQAKKLAKEKINKGLISKEQLELETKRIRWNLVAKEKGFKYEQKKW
jgi:hypothetical protein